MKPETLAKRAETLRIKKEIMAENEKWAERKALDEKKVQKLERLAADPAATEAEKANAREKAEGLRNKAKPRSKYAPPPLPRTAAEWEALRKTKRKPTGGRTTPASPATTPLPAKALAAAPRQPASREEALTAEIVRLNRKIARLEAALKQATEPVPAGKPGRKPLGERAMTAAERMRKMRLRNTAQ
ncbi:hypothetical protein IYW40_04680 [Methylocystis sp. H4A]|uniref:hypothetical protein n=1 Tax=Methylocystis sp. H4A TaxID=2785788 RepID=UPI0018C24437|nr:hypothetical protein [Methylocystis sp. H4A]MBG0800789.1 hypothetical protein [Methylocystis sp. H4A]